jgi:hypothetical protein
MDALLSIKVVCIYSRHELFLIFNFDHNHILFWFRYNVYAMIGNNVDMVNRYGFMSYMAFDQQEYNADYFQYDPVKIHPNQFITVMWKTQPINTHWFTVSSSVLSVGFILQWIFCLNWICKTRLDSRFNSILKPVVICFDYLPSLQLSLLAILLRLRSQLIDPVCWLCKDQWSKFITKLVGLMLLRMISFTHNRNSLAICAFK